MENKVAGWYGPLSLMMAQRIAGMVCCNNRMSRVTLVALVIFIQLEKLQSCGKTTVDIANDLQVQA